MSLNLQQLLGNLVHTVNHSLKPRGVEVELVEWEYMDDAMGDKPKQEEYNDELLNCDVCMVLCWQKFGKYTKWEFETAYQGFRSDKKMPRKIYIYYKIPGTDTVELQQFKSIIDSYGHFPTHFSHPDTLKLNFVQQLFAFALAQESDLLKVNGTKVELEGQELVNLSNVPCASGNDHYQSLSEDIRNLEKEVADLKEEVEDYKADLDEDPEDERAQRRLRRAESKLMDARQALSDKRKALEELCGNILDTNLKVAKIAGQKASARLKKAVELLEKGDYKGANAVLDFDEIKAEMAQNASRIDQARELEKAALEALKSNIEECKLKVKTLQTEKEEGWLAKCCEIYEDALRQAEGRISDAELADLRFYYAGLLRHNNQFQRSEELYEANIAVYRQLAAQSPEAYLPKVAHNIGGLAILHRTLRRYEQAEQEYDEAISICRQLAEQSPKAYLPDVARNIGNFATLHRDLCRYEQSEQEYDEAISIYRKLAEQSPEAYMPEVARNIGNLAFLHKNLHRYEQSEQECEEAIGIYRKLAEQSPEAYMPKVALHIGNLALLHRNLHRYEQSEQECEEAISIFRQLAATEPEAFLPNVAMAINGLSYTYSFQGKPELALITIEEAIATDPHNPHYFDSKGEFLLKLGRTDEALAVYHQILEMDADFFKNTESELEKGLKEKGRI